MYWLKNACNNNASTTDRFTFQFVTLTKRDMHIPLIICIDSAVNLKSFNFELHLWVRIFYMYKCRNWLAGGPYVWIHRPQSVRSYHNNRQIKWECFFAAIVKLFQPDVVCGWCIFVCVSCDVCAHQYSYVHILWMPLFFVRKFLSIYFYRMYGFCVYNLYF